MRVAEEDGLADVPKRRRFKLAVGTTIDDSTGEKGRSTGDSGELDNLFID